MGRDFSVTASRFRGLKASWWEWLLALVLIFTTVGLGYFVEQPDFWKAMPLFAIFFGIYLVLISVGNSNWKFFLLVSVFLRLLLVPTFPNLSDDIYRFVWDGRLILQGVNPFNYLPSQIISENLQFKGIDSELYARLNSPEYYTIYPPIAQLSFVLGVLFSPKSILGSAIVMKFILLAFECGSIILLIKLLRRWKLRESLSLIYALNPLVILEITGNLHFEGAMIFFLLLGLYYLDQGKWQFSAVAIAFSIACKLITLMFLPFFIVRLGWNRSISYFFIVGLVLLLLFAPLLGPFFIENFGNSLDLYFQQFEFNASVYYLLREWGFQKVGFNLIDHFGPLLKVATILAILWFVVLENKTSLRSLPNSLLFSISAYLFFATTVHPWYITLPLVLCVFTKFRFPVYWSGLIFLTYINYSYPEYYENLEIVWLEYIIVILAIFLELILKSKRKAMLESVT